MEYSIAELYAIDELTRIDYLKTRTYYTADTSVLPVTSAAYLAFSSRGWINEEEAKKDVSQLLETKRKLREGINASRSALARSTKEVKEAERETRRIEHIEAVNNARISSDEIETIRRHAILLLCEHRTSFVEKASLVAEKKGISLYDYIDSILQGR